MNTCEYIIKRGVEVKHQTSTVFSFFSTECVEETDFGPLITSFLMRLGPHFDAITQ